MCAGRRPNTDELNLQNTDVKLNNKGHIVVDDYDKTTVDDIYAVGDVVGKIDLTPVAIRAGRIVGLRLFGGREDLVMDYSNVPTVVFS